MLAVATILQIIGIIYNEVSYITQTGQYGQVYEELGVDKKSLKEAKEQWELEQQQEKARLSEQEKEKKTQRQSLQDITSGLGSGLDILSEYGDLQKDYELNLADETCKTLLAMTRLSYIPIILGVDIATLILGAFVIFLRWIIVKTDKDIQKSSQ